MIKCHLALLQEWKNNLDSVTYENNIDANLSKPSDKKEIDCHDSDMCWPTTIKGKIQWSLFITIMEHTENHLKLKQGLMTSLL